METHLTYCFDERKHIRFTHRPAPAVNADGTYRLNASASDCDEKYQSSQEKLYPATQWKVAGNTSSVACPRAESLPPSAAHASREFCTLRSAHWGSSANSTCVAHSLSRAMQRRRLTIFPIRRYFGGRALWATCGCTFLTCLSCGCCTCCTASQ